MSMKAVLTGVCLLLCLVVALGCGPKAPRMESGRGAVTGTVTFDGKPLPGGMLFFVSVKDPMYRGSAMIKSDGTFSVADAPEGDVLMVIQNEALKTNNPQAYVPIPSKYTDVKTSGLKATVGKGEPINIELKSK
jgi:hypothetical protein